MTTYTIIGLKRITASMALRLRKAQPEAAVFGYDSDSGTVQTTQALGATMPGPEDLREAIKQADVIILDLPLNRLPRLFIELGNLLKNNALVFDLAKLKGLGFKLAQQHNFSERYMGLTPILATASLAVVDQSVAAASLDALHESAWYLVYSPQTEQATIEQADALASILGEQVLLMDLMEYDGLIQGVETAPGLVAAAMFRAVTQSPGWRDMSRLAGSDFALSTRPLEAGADIAAIALQNSLGLIHHLDAVLQSLQEIRRFLEKNNQQGLEAFLLELKNERDQWLQKRTHNDWSEEDLFEEQPPTFFATLFGLGRRQKRKE